MLPKKARLTSRQMSFVMRKPTAKIFSKHLTCIYYTKEITESVVSFGVTMAKKLSRNSVDMHRKRRILYARLRESGFSTLQHSISNRLMLIVLIPKATFFSLSHSDQIQEYIRVAERLEQSY